MGTVDSDGSTYDIYTATRTFSEHDSTGPVR